MSKPNTLGSHADKKDAKNAARRARLNDAMYEINHYRDLAQDALDSGDLESAEGWIQALCEETQQALGGKAA